MGKNRKRQEILIASAITLVTTLFIYLAVEAWAAEEFLFYR